MVDWTGQAKGLVFPLAYLTLLIGLMATFSSLYRRRQLSRASSLEPWFPPHLQRNIYLSLLHMDQPSSSGAGGSSGSSEKSSEKSVTVPDPILRAALLRRAQEDIQRILSLRSAKQALTTLQQRGSVGDDLWQRFQRGEKELEAELQDVVAEANALAPNWGQAIFQSANEMATNARLRERIAEMQSKHEEERGWWERRRSEMESSLMEELEMEEKLKDEERGKGAGRKDSVANSVVTAGTAGSSDGEAVLVEGGAAKKKKNKGKKGAA